jgi:hypothetical protein
VLFLFSNIFISNSLQFLHFRSRAFLRSYIHSQSKEIVRLLWNKRSNTMFTRVRYWKPSTADPVKLFIFNLSSNCCKHALWECLLISAARPDMWDLSAHVLNYVTKHSKFIEMFWIDTNSFCTHQLATVKWITFSNSCKAYSGGSLCAGKWSETWWLIPLGIDWLPSLELIFLHGRL